MRLSGRNDTVRDTGSGRSRRRPATENQVSYTDLDDEWEASEKKVRDVSRSQNPEEYRVRYSETEEYDSSSNTDARRYGGGVSKDRSYENSYIENMEDTWVYNRDRVNTVSDSEAGSQSDTSCYEDDSDGKHRSYSGRYTESADGNQSRYTGRYEEESRDKQGYRSRYAYEDNERDSRGYSSRAKTKVKKVKKVKKVVAKDGKGITGKVSGAAMPWHFIGSSLCNSACHAASYDASGCRFYDRIPVAWQYRHDVCGEELGVDAVFGRSRLPGTAWFCIPLSGR